MAGWILETAYTIGRKHGFREADARDFVGWVSVRMIRRDYAVLRACRDRRRLRGYLCRVMRNLAKDYRNHLWGKWRPTTTARRLGLFAVELERLHLRDGFSEAEAIEFLCLNRPFAPSVDELEDMAAQMPMRSRRSQIEFDPEILGSEVAVEKDHTDFERRSARCHLRAGLSQALAMLEERDRELLALIFEDGRSIASIARELDLDQRSLYSRRDHCLRRLRELLQDQGLAWAQVSLALDADSAT